MPTRQENLDAAYKTACNLQRKRGWTIAELAKKMNATMHEAATTHQRFALK